ncbi:MAG: hypothetical protein LUD02_09765 [Tannerellaceae bacterium]|nr:hypothetical protein [Tannerellaceae bacterium]
MGDGVIDLIRQADRGFYLAIGRLKADCFCRLYACCYEQEKKGRKDMIDIFFMRIFVYKKGSFLLQTYRVSRKGFFVDETLCSFNEY